MAVEGFDEVVAPAHGHEASEHHRRTWGHEQWWVMKCGVMKSGVMKSGVMKGREEVRRVARGACR